MLVSNAEFFDDGVWIDVEFVFLGQTFEHAARLVQRRAQQRAVLGTKDDVFEDGEIRDQLEVLEDHADACVDRGLAVGDFGFATVDENVAAVGFIKSIKD